MLNNILKAELVKHLLHLTEKAERKGLPAKDALETAKSLLIFEVKKLCAELVKR